MIQALINHDANVNATNKENETTLTLACRNRNEGAIKVLLNARTKPNITDDAYGTGDTSLHEAIRENAAEK